MTKNPLIIRGLWTSGNRRTAFPPVSPGLWLRGIYCGSQLIAIQFIWIQACSEKFDLPALATSAAA